MKILHSNLSLSSGSSLLKTRYQIQILRQRYEEKFFIDLCILKFLAFLFNKFPLFKSYTRSYSHFSRTNFDDILFSFFLIRLIQTVSCLTLWSDNRQLKVNKVCCFKMQIYVLCHSVIFVGRDSRHLISPR